VLMLSPHDFQQVKQSCKLHHLDLVDHLQH
jgi:hypothetical protein